MARDPRAPVRVLPVRTDHAGHRIAQREQGSQRPGYRRRHVWQSVPLRHLSADSRRDPSGSKGAGMKIIENVSRRGFLQGVAVTGAFVLSAKFVPTQLWAGDEPAVPAPLQPLLWSSIAKDGTVTIIAHRTEMGNGIKTSLPIVLADELGADWKRVKIEQALGDPKYGDQETDTSHSVRDFFDLMRQTGGAARLMLVGAAAARWNVPATECDTSQPHLVVHRASERKI